MLARTQRVIIIGGGASGVLLAAHLLRSRRGQLLVTLVEQRPQLGAGVAYSTKHPNHLLNVRAANMSAFPDDVEHFARWLRDHAPASNRDVSDPACFAPRHLYREYLAGLLAPHFAEGRLRRIRSEAVAMEEDGRELKIVFRDGTSRTADCAVLATGNEGPNLPPATWRYDGWRNADVPPIDPDAGVVMVGTGLTMVDWVLTFIHAGHRGPITTISRHGLLPQEHRAVHPFLIDAFQVPFGASVTQTSRWLRAQVRKAEQKGGNWRAVIDALRPHTQRIWQEWTSPERRRFIRHARAWWDQHRHRIAPDAADHLRAAEARGQLRIIAGRVVGFEDRDEGADVFVVHRTAGQRERIHAQAVFECRGRASDITRSENLLVQSLLSSGRARPDPLQLGLDVTTDCAVIDRNGQPSDRIYAVGPITSGVFWEVTAVPDIRVQVARLAGQLRSGSAARAKSADSTDTGARGLTPVVMRR
jgi:uncharacterized NAD(P)/FAD-binding protein YdhS